MTYTLRPFESGDATSLAELTHASILAVGSKRYSSEQVEMWAARHPGPQRFLDRHDAGAWIWVAVDGNDNPVAYTLLEAAEDNAGHLDMLYCHPDHTRKGLAEQLLTMSEGEAREQGMTRLFTEASELARHAFERAGYTVLHRRDFEISDGDRTVAIHNYAMEKPLD